MLIGLTDPDRPADVDPLVELVETPSHLEQLVHRALTRVIDPEIRKPITDLDMVGSIAVAADGAATVGIKLTIIGCPAADSIERDVRTAVAAVPGVTRTHVDVTIMTREERKSLTEKLRGAGRVMQFGPDSLTHIFTVTSGKGGVGKSTLTANLAVALAARGLKVGLVDADVFGFSIPGILGIPDAKPTRVGEMILPPIAHEEHTSELQSRPHLVCRLLLEKKKHVT